jgi:hypothetical protein
VALAFAAAGAEAAPGLDATGYDAALCVTAQRLLVGQPEIPVRVQSGAGNGFYTIQMSIDEADRTLVVAMTTEMARRADGSEYPAWVACKMVNRERAAAVLGLRTPAPERICRDVNAHTLEVALGRLGATERERLAAIGTGIELAPDTVLPTGGEWLPAPAAQYVTPLAGGGYRVSAPSVAVPWDDRERGFFQGTRHCKLLTLATVESWLRARAAGAATGLVPQAAAACAAPATLASRTGSCLFYFAPVDALVCQDYSGVAWTAEAAQAECARRHASRAALQAAKNRYEGAGGLWRDGSCAARDDAPARSGTCVFQCGEPDETLWHLPGQSAAPAAALARFCKVFVPAPAAPPASMLRAVPGTGFGVTLILSVGDTVDGYQPPGVLDGMAAFALDADTVRVFVNHELAPLAGYPYRLANGTELRGSRVSRLDIDRRTRRIRAAGLAYERVFDRAGQPVTTAAQVSERPALAQAGFDSFCSATGVVAGSAGFVDDIFFTHEEASAREGEHPHGGSIWALDVRTASLHALPELGRGSWENLAAVPTPDGARADGHVALLLGDDLEYGAAPLYLWIGRKQPGGDFLARNGLARGQLFVWVAESGDRTPAQWQGSGSRRRGRFVALPTRDPARAGAAGYDTAGYADDTTLRRMAAERGAFLFSRPEDLHANPHDPLEVVFASTGQGEVYPADDWGELYVIRMRFEAAAEGRLHAAAELQLLYDGDATADGGIRNPDNLVWAVDGNVYVQEDKAVKRGRFGAGGQEASIWKLAPDRPGEPVRIAVIERAAVPGGATDARASVPGEWETSGLIDLSVLLGVWPRELVLLGTVQAHSVTDGPIGGRERLVQGGQLFWLTAPQR